MFTRNYKMLITDEANNYMSQERKEKHYLSQRSNMKYKTKKIYAEKTVRNKDKYIKHQQINEILR